MQSFGEPIELGAQWIHGGCEGNPVFDLAVKHELHLGGDAGGQKGEEEGLMQDRIIFSEHMHTSSAKAIGPAATTAAAEIYGEIIDAAQDYFEGTYKTNRTRYV